jgi:hypothetical protein
VVQVDQVVQVVQEDKMIHVNSNNNWEMLHVNPKTQVVSWTNLE